MNTDEVRIRCRPCGVLFPVTGAVDGAVVQCPGCYRMLTIRLIEPPSRRSPLAPAEPGFGEVLLKILGYATVGVVAYKGLQAIFDEDFGGGEFPGWFRDEMREKHVAHNGCRCPRCARRVRYEDLTVDHVVSMKNDGRTSRANAEVMCRGCNSQKGAQNGFIDYIRGRSY